MKVLISALLACGSIGLVMVPATAQEHQGCFMVNGAGRMIRLNDMCPQASAQPATPQEDLRTSRLC